MPHGPALKRRQVLALLATTLVVAEVAHARNAPAEAAAEWPTARLLGSGRLRFLGLLVYDIRLWTPEATWAADDWARTPLALEIEYARGLDGKAIAERSVEEMRRSGPIAGDTESRWLRAMSELFPDVKAGDRITGIQLPGLATRFFYNGTLRGEVRDAEFTRRFFGIWLGASTSEPQLRAALLGRP